jgi:hypothetical protein
LIQDEGEFASYYVAVRDLGNGGEKEIGIVDFTATCICENVMLL